MVPGPARWTHRRPEGRYSPLLPYRTSRDSPYFLTTTPPVESEVAVMTMTTTHTYHDESHDSLHFAHHVLLYRTSSFYDIFISWASLSSIFIYYILSTRMSVTFALLRCLAICAGPYSCAAIFPQARTGHLRLD